MLTGGPVSKRFTPRDLVVVVVLVVVVDLCVVFTSKSPSGLWVI